MINLSQKHWYISPEANESEVSKQCDIFKENVLYKAKTSKKAFVLTTQSIDDLRSNQQNKLWWSQIITKGFLPTMQILVDKKRAKEGKSKIYLTAEDVHSRIIYKNEYGIWDTKYDKKIYDIDTGEYKIVRETKKLSTKQFGLLMERAVEFLKDEWNIHLELPLDKGIEGMYYAV